MTQRIALITGASRGIGRALAVELARQKTHVIALARTQGALEELDDEITSLGGSATLVPLNLKDYDAFNRLSETILERWGKLDILVGNAGILGELSPLAHIDQSVWDAVMGINVTTNWRLLKSMDLALRLSEAGRVVMITSGAAHSCKSYWGPYSISKAALEALAKTYASETSTTPLRVTLFNPGPVRTNMRKIAMPGEDQSKLPTPQEVASHILPFLSSNWQKTGTLECFQSA